LSEEQHDEVKNTVFIDIPDGFSFKATVYSHGWCELAPFELDDENWRLTYVFRDRKNNAIPGVISEDGDRIRIDMSTSGFDPTEIINNARHLLRLDDDLDGFYKTLEGHERLKWVATSRAGRMLRSASVFEDLVKTICTTNCSWGLTKSMVTNLVDKLGTPAPGGQKAFPTAEAMAAVSADFYRSEIRAGYRSPYFVELAEAVAGGKLDPEKWLVSDLPTPDLKKEMKKVKGVGDYAAENLLKLVGRYDGLALDSWLRSQFYKNHNNEKACPDKKIERHYEKFGKWRGLVIWCDMTEKWIN
jgi:3-methyladenine DNA glycosylase/8-oxoguanine DNA glycosylase